MEAATMPEPKIMRFYPISHISATKITAAVLHARCDFGNAIVTRVSLSLVFHQVTALRRRFSGSS